MWFFEFLVVLQYYYREILDEYFEKTVRENILQGLLPRLVIREWAYSPDLFYYVSGQFERLCWTSPVRGVLGL